METTNDYFCAISPSKHPEALINGPGAEDLEEHGPLRDAIREQRSRIISAYLEVLEGMSEPIAVDSQLPFPKEQIGHAILLELADDPESDLRRELEIAYILLESFIPYEQYRVIEDFKKASRCSQRIAELGDPKSLLRSARIIRKAKGDSAVRLQEEIHEKMRKRQLEIQNLGDSNAA